MTNDSHNLSSDSTNEIKRLARRIVSHCQSDRFTGLVANLRKAEEILLDEIAEAVQKPLNVMLQHLPSATYEEKKTVAKTANSVLAHLGLAIRCPKSGVAGYLIASPVEKQSAGRFQIVAPTDDFPKRRTFSSVDLPELELVAAIDVRRHGQKWADRIVSNNKSRTR